MKNVNNPLASTRRSFMKKSAVAASNLTVFSGLVNAATGGGSGGDPILCVKTYYRDGQVNPATGEWVENESWGCTVSPCGWPGDFACGEAFNPQTLELEEVRVGCAQSTRCVSPFIEEAAQPDGTWEEIPNPNIP